MLNIICVSVFVVIFSIAEKSGDFELNPSGNTGFELIFFSNSFVNEEA